MVQTDKPASRVGRLTQCWSAYAALAEPIVYPQDFCFQTVIRYDLVRYLGFAYKSAADFKLFWPLAPVLLALAATPLVAFGARCLPSPTVGSGPAFKPTFLRRAAYFFARFISLLFANVRF